MQQSYRVRVWSLSCRCVLRLQDNDGGMTAQLPSTITSYVQTGLRPGEEYTVNLVALRDQGRSQPVTATVTTCKYLIHTVLYIQYLSIN